MDEIKTQLETEKAHSAFLELLLEALYGPGWEKLTLHQAKVWRRRYLTSHSSRVANRTYIDSMDNKCQLVEVDE